MEGDFCYLSSNICISTEFRGCGWLHNLGWTGGSFRFRSIPFYTVLYDTYIPPLGAEAVGRVERATEGFMQ